MEINKSSRLRNIKEQSKKHEKDFNPKKITENELKKEKASQNKLKDIASLNKLFKNKINIKPKNDINISFLLNLFIIFISIPYINLRKLTSKMKFL